MACAHWAVGGAPYCVQVNASKLAFRLLCRRHGAQLCYTPMLSMRSVVSQKRNAFRTHPDDQPLIVQVLMAACVVLQLSRLQQGAAYQASGCDASDWRRRP